MTEHETPDGMRRDVTALLQRLVACDTSNPPGREAQAAAILEDYLQPLGVECERVAKDPERPNLLARLRGRGTGPSLAFLGHLDVVQARRHGWTLEPFAGVEHDGAIWGRGTIDMKCQVAATAVALATLAREQFVPSGDLMLILTADEEVGDAGVGAPFSSRRSPTCDRITWSAKERASATRRRGGRSTSSTTASRPQRPPPSPSAAAQPTPHSPKTAPTPRSSSRDC